MYLNNNSKGVKSFFLENKKILIAPFTSFKINPNNINLFSHYKLTLEPLFSVTEGKVIYTKPNNQNTKEEVIEQITEDISKEDLIQENIESSNPQNENNSLDLNDLDVDNELQKINHSKNKKKTKKS